MCAKLAVPRIGCSVWRELVVIARERSGGKIGNGVGFRQTAKVQPSQLQDGGCTCVDPGFKFLEQLKSYLGVFEEQMQDKNPGSRQKSSNSGGGRLRVQAVC